MLIFENGEPMGYLLIVILYAFINIIGAGINSWYLLSGKKAKNLYIPTVVGTTILVVIFTSIFITISIKNGHTWYEAWRFLINIFSCNIFFFLVPQAIAVYAANYYFRKPYAVVLALFFISIVALIAMVELSILYAIWYCQTFKITPD